MRRLASATTAVAILFLARAAAAEDAAEEARRLYDRGSELEEQGDLAGAYEAFRRAAELRPTFRLHRHMGRVCLGLGRHGQALEHFELFLSEGGDRLGAEERREAEEGLERARAGLETALDGGGAPRVEPETIDAGPDVGPEEPAPAPPAPAAPRESGLRPAWLWTALAVTAAALTTGAVLGGLALAEQDAFDALNRPDRTDGEDALLEDHRARGEALGLGADVLLFGGAALAVGTVVLGLLTDFGGGPVLATVRSGLRRDAVALALEGRF